MAKQDDDHRTLTDQQVCGFSRENRMMIENLCESFDRFTSRFETFCTKIEADMSKAFAHLSDAYSKTAGKPSWGTLILVSFLSSLCVACITVILTKAIK